MEPRLIIAYGLTLLLTLFAAGFVGYRIYHAHERSYRRRQRKEKRAFEARETPRP